MVHCENGDVDRRARRARAGRRADRPDPPRAHAPGVRRGRGDAAAPCGWPSCAGAPRLHRARDLRAGGRRDRGRPGARRERVAARPASSTSTNTIDDLERPDFEGARYVCSPPLRDASNQELLWAALDRGVLESVSTDHCPFNNEQKALGRDDFSKIPNGLAMIQHRLVKLWDLGVESGPDHAERARRPDLDGDRAPLRPAPQGRDRARQGRRPRRLRPVDAVRVLHARRSHMNVDYDLFEGETLDRQRAPHALPRRRWSTTAARSARSPGTAASCRARWRRAAAACAS